MAMTSSRRLLLLAAVIVLSPFILAPSCYISTNPTPTGFKLGVPFRRQLNDDYCGAAATLMWRLFRGGSEVTQQQIYETMGGSGSGVSAGAIASAVSLWAGDYADVDYASGIGDPQQLVDHFFARQIASVNHRVPVIPIVNRGFHAGVIDGGSNHLRSDGVYVWDSVYFHDPDESVGSADVKYTAGSWSDYMCGGGAACTQVINMGAAAGWQDPYDDYGDSTIMRGGLREQDRQPLYL